MSKQVRLRGQRHGRARGVRVRRGLLLLLPGALVLALWWGWGPPDAGARAPGSLDVAADLEAELPIAISVGAFEIRIEDRGEGVVVAVSHASEPARELWASLPGQAFVAAGVGRESVAMSRGHFRVTDDLRIRLSEQVLELVEVEGGELTLAGSVTDLQGGMRSDYRLVFEEATGFIRARS